MKNHLKDRTSVILTLLVGILLTLGLLPSFTALSSSIYHVFPMAQKFLGPLNALKVGIPIFIFYFLIHRKRFPQILFRSLVIIYGLLLFFGGISLIRCGFPSAATRELAIMSFGMLAAVAFYLLPHLYQKRVLGAWLGITVLSIVIDIFTPNLLDWFYQNLFDPQTRALDQDEVGSWVLTGFFGRQSLGKILSWLPWLFLVYFFPNQNSKNQAKWWGTAVLLLSWSAAGILATSQRGPLAALLGGVGVFGLHQILVRKNQKLALLSLGLILLSGVVTWVFVPKEVFETRVISLFYSEPESRHQKIARGTFEYRKRIWDASLDTIRSHPFGNACISLEHFQKYHVNSQAHSHNLFMEQFRSRGWIWGIFHFLLWVWILVGVWRSKNLTDSFLLGGLVTFFLGSMLDHPWIVLNHSVLISIFLILGLERRKK